MVLPCVRSRNAGAAFALRNPPCPDAVGSAIGPEDKTRCLRLAVPKRGYIWVTVRHSKSRRPRVPSRIQKGIPGLGVAGCTGLEPVASGVTGRRYNQLN